MSGGIAYVYDPEERLPGRLNPQMVRLERIEHEGEAADLAALLRHHAQMTGSDHAVSLLADWQQALGSFWRVVPETAAQAARPLQGVVYRVHEGAAAAAIAAVAAG